MTGNELLALFKENEKRCHVIGSAECGIVAALDLEGRLYAVRAGRVLNRVNPAAIAGISTRKGYINPGGDGLWPAPEGTTLGHQYATGSWRVPPGLTGARFQVTEETPGRAVIEAEVDLINARGIGLPTIFRRDISVDGDLTVKVVESIHYIGVHTLEGDEALLAPWSLGQFDCVPDCEVVFPAAGADYWDLYSPPGDACPVRDGLVVFRTDSPDRRQIGIGPATPWIEFRRPIDGLRIRRHAVCAWPGIDIADAPPDVAPAARQTRYSVYSDPDGFMEIEAVGGCPAKLSPGIELAVEIITEYGRMS